MTGKDSQLPQMYQSGCGHVLSLAALCCTVHGCDLLPSAAVTRRGGMPPVPARVDAGGAQGVGRASGLDWSGLGNASHGRCWADTGAAIQCRHSMSLTQQHFTALITQVLAPDVVRAQRQSILPAAPAVNKGSTDTRRYPKFPITISSLPSAQAKVQCSRLHRTACISRCLVGLLIILSTGW